MKNKIILEKIEALMNKYPQMRFCQLMYVVTAEIKPDMFYIEDDKFIKLANRFMLENE